MFIIWLAVGAVIGFVVGVLVYRNNVKRLEAEIKRIQDELDKAKNRIKKV